MRPWRPRGRHPLHGGAPPAFRALVAQHPEVDGEAGGRLGVEEGDELGRQRRPRARVPPPGGPHAQEPQPRRRARAVGRGLAPLAPAGGDLPGLAVADRDVEGAEGDGDLAARAGGAGRVAVRPADRDRSPLAAPPGLPSRARERRRRQRRERLPVSSEQLGLGRDEPVAALALAQVEAVFEQPAVERAGAVERRGGDE